MLNPNVLRPWWHFNDNDGGIQTTEQTQHCTEGQCQFLSNCHTFGNVQRQHYNRKWQWSNWSIDFNWGNHQMSPSGMLRRRSMIWISEWSWRNVSTGDLCDWSRQHRRSGVLQCHAVSRQVLSSGSPPQDHHRCRWASLQLIYFSSVSGFSSRFPLSTVWSPWWYSLIDNSPVLGKYWNRNWNTGVRHREHPWPHLGYSQLCW